VPAAELSPSIVTPVLDADLTDKTILGSELSFNIAMQTGVLPETKVPAVNEIAQAPALTFPTALIHVPNCAIIDDAASQLI